MISKCTAIVPSKYRLFRRKQLGVALAIMERHTECFLCISIVVILLPNFARPEDCTKIYSASHGSISDFFQGGDSLRICQYHILSPLDHYIVLNLTRLVGFATKNLQTCLPSLIIQSASSSSSNSTVQRVKKICGQNETLPLIVQSEAENLTILYSGGSSLQDSGFFASYTFRRNINDPKITEFVKTQKDTSKTVNNTIEKNRHTAFTGTVPPHSEKDSGQQDLKPFEILVLLVLAPVTLFCVLCVIVLYYRKRTPCFVPESDMSRNAARASTPSDIDVTTIASNSPLLQDNPRFSIQHQQKSMRQHSAMLCRRSASTEKFPATICLKDEEETRYMRNNIAQLHKDVTSDHSICRDGIRAPPNRTVSDTEMYDLEQHKHMPHVLSRTSFQTNQHTPPPNRGRGKLTPNRSGNEYVIDSVTHSPIHLVDSDSEGPPPYSFISAPRAVVNNNLVNVCDTSEGTAESICRESQQLRHSNPSATILSHDRGTLLSSPLPPHLQGVGRGGGLVD